MEKNKYFVRYIKISPTTNRKNYSLDKLLFNYEGDVYEPLNFNETWNDITPNECAKAFENKLYKYSDKFIQVENIIYTTSPEIIKDKLKYEYNTTFNAFNIYVSNQNSQQIYNISEPEHLPNPLDEHVNLPAHIRRVKTNYENNKYKKEIWFGLYKYNSNTNKYDFIPTSLYDKKTQMYWIYDNDM